MNKALLVGLLLLSIMPSAALAGNVPVVAAVPEIDPGMATGGLALLAVGALLVFERYRR